MSHGHVHHAKVTRVKLALTFLLCLTALHPIIGIVASLCWLWIEED